MNLNFVNTRLIFILLIVTCIFSGCVMNETHGSSATNESDVTVETLMQKSVKKSLDFDDYIKNEWNHIPRDNLNSDEFQEFIVNNDTIEYKLNFKSRIISLNYFLIPIKDIYYDNSLWCSVNSSLNNDTDEMVIVEEYYIANFILENDDAETVGSIMINCSSPEECLNVSLSMVENLEIEQIFNADCIPDYKKFEYLCVIKCNYKNGERGFVKFTNDQIVLYYQNEFIKDYLDEWFNVVILYHCE